MVWLWGGVPTSELLHMDATHVLDFALQAQGRSILDKLLAVQLRVIAFWRCSVGLAPTVQSQACLVWGVSG